MTRTADFDDVQDGLGSAREIPRVIGKLASSKKKEREVAYVELSDERLVHQGTRWEAALPAVSLLLDELRRPKHPGRDLVLATLAHVAVAHPPSFARDATPADVQGLLADSELAGQCYRAVCAVASDIAAHLESRRAATRAEAAALLALIAPDLACERLAPDEEADDETRAVLILALGVALRLSGGKPAVGAPPRSPKLVRVAHHIARALIDEPVEPAELAFALAAPLAAVTTPYGRFNQLALSAVVRLGDVGAPVLERALETGDPSQKPVVARALVCATFPACAAGGEAPLVSVDSLSPGERAVLELVVKAATENSWAPLRPLRAVGISDWRPCLRRFLGLDAHGPLEARVAWRGREVEAFVVMDDLARGEASEDETRAALIASLSPTARADLALLVNDHVYGLVIRKPWTAERADAFACSLVDDPATWPRVRQRIADFEHGKSWGAWIMLAACLRHGTSEGDVGLAPIFHSVIARSRGAFADRVRDALAAAPASLRDELVGSFPLPDLVDSRPTIGGKPVAPAFAGWGVLDLAADRAAAARRGAHAIARWSPVPEGGHGRDVHPVEAAEQSMKALMPEAREAIREALGDATKEGRMVLERLARG